MVNKIALTVISIMSMLSLAMFISASSFHPVEEIVPSTEEAAIGKYSRYYEGSKVSADEISVITEPRRDLDPLAISHYKEAHETTSIVPLAVFERCILFFVFSNPKSIDLDETSTKKVISQKHPRYFNAEGAYKAIEVR